MVTHLDPKTKDLLLELHPGTFLLMHVATTTKLCNPTFLPAQN